MNNPIISIIVPVYKVEQYLKECLDSILASTFSDFELLLVDDGSPDQSGDVCDEYAMKDRRIKVFHKPNGGVSSARNLGLDNAQGEWVTFIDSDDLITPTFLEGLYRPIANGECVDFVQGGCTNYECGHPSTINNQFEYYVGSEPSIVFERMVGLTASKLFRLENIRAWSNGISLTFDERIKMREDLAFTIDYLLHCNRFAFVEETGYYYRLDNAGSAMNTLRFNNYELERYTHYHLRNSILAAIAKFNLPKDKFYRHFGSPLSCMRMVNAMYKQPLPRKTRISNLKKDLLEIDYEILPYCTFNRRFRWGLAMLLHYRLLRLFDLCSSILRKYC